MDRKSGLKLYSGNFVISNTLLLEQIPPRGHEVCFENCLKASINEAAFWGLMVLFAAVIARKGRCVSSHLLLYFSLWWLLAVLNALFCVPSIYSVDVGINPGGLL